MVTIVLYMSAASAVRLHNRSGYADVTIYIIAISMCLYKVYMVSHFSMFRHISIDITYTLMQKCLLLQQSEVVQPID